MTALLKTFTRTQIIIASAVLIFLCCACGTIAARLPGSTTTIATHASTMTATTLSTHIAATATSLPETRTQRATRIALAATNASLYGGHDAITQITTYDTPTNAVLVTITLTSIWDISEAQRRVKGLSFAVESTFWQSQFLPDEIDVAFVGPLIDSYGTKSVGSYGYAHLSKATAHLFVWSNLDADTAWLDYDEQAVRQQ